MNIETWLTADDYIDNFVSKCRKSDWDFDADAWDANKNNMAVWSHNADKKASLYRIGKPEW